MSEDKKTEDKKQAKKGPKPLSKEDIIDGLMIQDIANPERIYKVNEFRDGSIFCTLEETGQRWQFNLSQIVLFTKYKG